MVATQFTDVDRSESKTGDRFSSGGICPPTLPQEQTRMSMQTSKTENALKDLRCAVDRLKARLHPIIRDEAKPTTEAPKRPPSDVACEFEAHMEGVREVIFRVREDIEFLTERSAV